MKNLLAKFGGWIATAAKTVWNLILEAGIGNILKAGVFIGTSVASLVLFIKYLRDKKKIIEMNLKDENDSATAKAPVEEALKDNMSDATVRKEELNPKLRRDIASVIDDRCPKYKKKSKKNSVFTKRPKKLTKKRRKEIATMFEDLKDDTNYSVLVDSIDADVKYAYKKWQDKIADSGVDNFELVRILHSPAWA